MSADVTGLISWLRSWFDDIYQLKGQGSGISINDVYPVGSVYMSVKNVNPATLFGGTWVQIEDQFLLASGSTYTSTYDNNGFANKTGGSADAVVVSHNHTQNPHTHTQDSHNHTQNSHSHNANSYKLVQTDDLKRTSERAYTSTNSSGIKYFYHGSTGSYSLSANVKGTTATNNAATATNQNATATNNASGEDGTGKNMPPYLVVNVWKRTA